MSYGQPPYGQPGMPPMQYGPMGMPGSGPATSPYMPSEPGPYEYKGRGFGPSILAIAGAIIILFGTIMMAIPAFWAASLPKDVSKSDIQTMTALPGVAWILIGIGIVLIVFGLSKSIMAKR